MTQVHVIPAYLADMRADAVIAALCEVTRSEAAQWIMAGRVTWALDGPQGRQAGRPIKKSEKFQEAAQIRVDRPEQVAPGEVEVEPVQDMTVLYQDAAMIAVDKPAGVAAHPSPGWHGPTVIGGLLAAGVEIATSGAQERRGIVQRLDVGTSGVMVVAKTEQAYSVLKQAFRDRTPTKTYHALVQGFPDPHEGTIDAPIGRHPGHDWRFTVIEGGREARTHYRLIEAFGSASLLELGLETGRTHQIRVHCAALGHPCAGDLTYGADPQLASDLGLTRQWLHAAQLDITHPVTGEPISFNSEYAQDLSEAVEILRGVGA